MEGMMQKNPQIPQRRGEIECSLEFLSTQADRLEKIASDFAARLKPLVRPEGKPEKKEQCPNPSTELACRIHILSVRIKNVCDAGEEGLQRLEI